MEKVEKRFLLKFVGTKAELHKKLKELCAKEEISMNEKIIDIIKKEVKK